MQTSMENIRQTGLLLPITIVARGCACISGITLLIGTCLLVLSSRGYFAPRQVAIQEIRTELDRKTPPSGSLAEIEGLRAQFRYLDDERWSKAKDLMSGWVEAWSPDPKEKSRFIAEIRNVANKFPPERRSAAVDTFYRLKQERRREAALLQQNSWYSQLGTVSAVLVSLIVFGIFSLLLTLLKIERNTRSINDGNSSKNVESLER